MNNCSERLYNGIVKENPTFVLMLGMSGLHSYCHLHVDCHPWYPHPMTMPRHVQRPGQEQPLPVVPGQLIHQPVDYSGVGTLTVSYTTTASGSTAFTKTLREESAVARGAVGHAPAPERFLALKTHLAVLCPQ